MSQNQAIDFHDIIASEFDQKYEKSADFRERYRILTQTLRWYVIPGQQVMDMGCGSGIFSNYLAELGCDVIGIDGSAAMISLCNQKKKSATSRYVRQVLPLENPNQYARQDVILMSSLLEYIPDSQKMLEQVATLLKPNGLFIVSIPNQLSIYRRAEWILFQRIGRPRYVAHSLYHSTEKAFTHMAENLGFDVLDLRYFSGNDPISRLLRLFLPHQYVNNLFLAVCRITDRNR